MLIYVVEDEAISRDHLTRMLRTQQHEVVTFANAVEATDYILSHTVPDVALIDFRLESYPNGIVLATQLRRMYPHIGVVMISKYATNKDVAEAFRGGIDDFLIRPVEIPALIDSISEAALMHRPGAQHLMAGNPIGDLRFDADAQRVFWCGVDLQLTPTEFALLTQIVARPATIINYAELYSLVRGEHLTPSDARNRLKSHISNIKVKVERAAPNKPCPLRVRRGYGVYWDTNRTAQTSDLDEEE